MLPIISPIGNTFLYNHSIDLAEITVEVYIRCHINKQQSRTSPEHWNMVSMFPSLPLLPFHLAQAEGFHPLTQTTNAYSVGISERLDVLDATAEHPKQPFCFLPLWGQPGDQSKFSYSVATIHFSSGRWEFPNSHPTTMPLRYYK